MILGNVSFLLPWTLAAFVLIPALWYLLNVSPPKPKTIKFPAVRILQEMSNTHTIAKKTPWWILLLRSLIISMLIFAMSQPVWDENHAQDGIDTPMVLILDNDWSMMDRWESQKGEAHRLLERAERNDQKVALFTNTQQHQPEFLSAKKTRAFLDTLKAQPWPGQRADILDGITKLLSQSQGALSIIWLSNSIDDETDFTKELHQFGDLELIHNSRSPLPPIIQNASRTDHGFDLDIHLHEQAEMDSIDIEVRNDENTVLISQPFAMTARQSFQKLSLSLPVELKQQAERLQIKGFINPASQFILDEKWRDRPVGIIKASSNDKALLEPAYYVRKGLSPHATIFEDDVISLLARKPSLIFDVAYDPLSPEAKSLLSNWIEGGGLFIRFANEKLAISAKDHEIDLLPVRLLQGQRNFGGTLSWKNPAQLDTFPDHGPFKDLKVNSEVTIKQQVLARPDVQLAQKTWARLKDGTPLITAEQKGMGWIILFHVDAIPSWSNLPISGTFELMLKRLLSFSTGQSPVAIDQDLAAYKVFDHHGQLNIPNTALDAINPVQRGLNASKETPPGLYGTKSGLFAFNLGPYIKEMKAIKNIPLGVIQRGFEETKQKELSSWFLTAALILILIDSLIQVTWLKKLRAAPVGIFMATILFTAPTMADDDIAIAAANHMRLAYMQTGDSDLDKTVYRGLEGLGDVLRRRTAVELAPSHPFDPERDDPSLFPMIYWPISEDQPEPSDKAIEKLNKFIRSGGFILFDTMGQNRSIKLKELTKNLDISPLQQVPKDHVLRRSFYLLKEFPGRYNHNDIWVEAVQNTLNDRVSSVLVGRNSWAHAWARDESFRPLYPVVPGGEGQRERAYRFGVNLVMYVLSGNYKADQVHIPAIIQRLGL
jgi:hypothetical protein